MNKKIIGLVTVVLLMVGMSMPTVAQRGNGNGCGNGDGYSEGRNNNEPGLYNKIPDLTDQQKDQIKTIRTEHLGDVQDQRSAMKVLRAELEVLTTADEVNMKQVNKKIDEIGALQTKMLKEKATHHNEIRNLLTEEQRLVFDSRKDRRDNKRNKRMGNKRGNRDYKENGRRGQRRMDRDND